MIFYYYLGLRKQIQYFVKYLLIQHNLYPSASHRFTVILLIIEELFENQIGYSIPFPCQQEYWQIRYSHYYRLVFHKYVLLQNNIKEHLQRNVDPDILIQDYIVYMLSINLYDFHLSSKFIIILYNTSKLFLIVAIYDNLNQYNKKFL